MIWKIILYVFITIVFTGLLAVVQQKINLSFEKIVLPQLAPAIGTLIMILIFFDLKFPITIDFNKLIALKSVLALGIPFLLFITPFFYRETSWTRSKTYRRLMKFDSTNVCGYFNRLNRRRNWLEKLFTTDT
jgi:hypothetical protein